MTFTATEHSFAGPDSLPAGWTRIRLRNQGSQFHHLLLTKLAEGKSLADFTAAVQANQSPGPDLLTENGGVNILSPGTDGTVVVNLQPGTYVISCFVNDLGDPQQVPHAAKGMVKQLTVTAARGAAAQPRSTVTVDGTEFSFTITPDITAGTQTIRFNNVGQQHHELQLIQLDPGKTVDDFVAAFGPDAPSGAPPAKALGGVAGLEARDHAYFQAQFSAGNYAFVCFQSDVTGDGAPHSTKGMVQEFTVR